MSTWDPVCEALARHIAAIEEVGVSQVHRDRAAAALKHLDELSEAPRITLPGYTGARTAICPDHGCDLTQETDGFDCPHPDHADVALPFSYVIMDDGDE